MPWFVVSRSDSTLRGHYPVETDAICEELGPFDAHFLIPAFFEGGRITRGGMHYVLTNDGPVPAHKTPFAKDAAFGYSTAYLPEYVEEKTGGRIRAADVRQFAPEQDSREVLARLRRLSGNECCVVNAENQSELDVFAGFVLRAAGEGKRFLFRSAASLLTSLARLPEQPVTPGEMSRYVKDGRPGLVVVGSHVPLSTRQLEHLLACRSVAHIEIDVGRIPDSTAQVEREVRDKLKNLHEAGSDVVISTSRAERRFDSKNEQLLFGAQVSALLTRLVRRAPRSLGFIVSKGGITSNDVLSSGLNLVTARIVGQIHPGCSVVLTPPTHRHSEMPVVIFPGNVGEDDSLTLVYDRLSGS